jgi:sugar lactone lactonase YvrE
MGHRKQWLGVTVFLGAVMTAVAAWGAGPAWLPNFPLRAGDNILLMWIPVPGAQSYNLYRADSAGGEPQKIGSSATTTYTDPVKDKTKTIEYTIRAVVGEQEGEPSSKGVIVGMIPLAAPEFTGAREVEEGKFSILWNSVPKAVFYNLYVAEKKDGPFSLVTSVQGTRYVESGLKEGQSAFYTVSAVNQASVESPRAEPLLVKRKIKKVKVKKKTIPLVVRKAKKVWRYKGDKNNPLSASRDLVVMKNGNIAVVSGKDVQVISPKGGFLFRFAGASTPKEMVTWGDATGIGIDEDGTFVVTYMRPGVIRTFNPTGEIIAQTTVTRVDSRKTTDGYIQNPLVSDADFAADGTIWATENNNFQLIHYSRDLKEIGRIGKPIGDKKRDPKVELISPSRIAIDREAGKIFVTEPIEARVSIWRENGTRVGSIGGSMGQAPGEFNIPGGLSFTPDRVLLVGDTNLARVQAFDKNGKYLLTFHDASRKESEKPEAIGYPNGIAAAGDRLYFSEDIGQQVVTYQLVE